MHEHWRGAADIESFGAGLAESCSSYGLDCEELHDDADWRIMFSRSLGGAAIRYVLLHCV